MLVKFKIILDINSEVLFTIYHNNICAVTIFIFHLVVKLWVIFTNVQNFTLIHIEKHKPLNGPLAYIFNIILNHFKVFNVLQIFIQSNSLQNELTSDGKSFTYNMNNKGPRKKPWFKLYFICIIYDKYTNNTECDYNTTTIHMGFRSRSNDLFESVSQVFTLLIYVLFCRNCHLCRE